MKKFFFIVTIVSLISSPLAVFASPGPIDQYGGHYNESGLYHYHEIPLYPNFYFGDIINPGSGYTFYQPKITATKLISNPITLATNTLIENPALDVSYCQGKQVFAQGKYDSANRARIKPVCVNVDDDIFHNKDLTSANYYKALLNNNEQVDKVYHYRINYAGKKIVTDRPTLNDLKGQLIQGETDMARYFVDGNLQLREVTSWDAQILKGFDYQNSIIYFDDSIVYSFPIGTVWK